MKLILTAIALFCLVEQPVFAMSSAEQRTEKQKQDQKTTREQQQRSKQQQMSRSEQKSKGNEKSLSRTATQTFNRIQSNTKTATRSESGAWQVTINPISFILREMRALGWDKRAFFIKNEDLGVSYHVQGRASSGIIDMNKKNFMEANSRMHAQLGPDVVENLEFYISLLNYTGEVASAAADNMRQFPIPGLNEIEDHARRAVTAAARDIKGEMLNIYDCHYAGSIQDFRCNNGEYTLKLTDSIPILKKQGVPFFSGTDVGFTKPTLTVSLSESTRQALSMLEQQQETASIARMIRDYTQKLRSKGKTETAQRIQNAFVEKAMTESKNLSTTATAQAINSGSPMNVLNIFK